MAVIFDTVSSGLSYKNSAGDITRGNINLGQYDAAIKGLIEHESDLHTKNDTFIKSVFNVMKSKHHIESFAQGGGFSDFEVVKEGAKHPLDTLPEMLDKQFRHAKFAKAFTITDIMMEDSLTNEMKRAAVNFTRAYYSTRNHFASLILHGGVGAHTTVAFGKENFDVTAVDGLPLFNKAHLYGGTGTQSNLHYATLGSGAKIDQALIEAALSAAAEKVRNLKDENGNSIGYTVDTVVIPSDDYALESAMRKALGSEYSSAPDGALSGAINTQYGKMNLIIDPFWNRTTATAHPFIVMSKEASKYLNGAVWLDRTDLVVSNRYDQDNGDYVWNGKARWSAGFVSYKFADMFQILDYNTTVLADGQTADSTNNGVAIEVKL